MLQITPNGPYGKDVHPRMPVSLEELIEDLRPCFEAGARGGAPSYPRQAGQRVLETT